MRKVEKIIGQLILLAYCWLPNPAFAQYNTKGDITIASPTAASLGKYADIPVGFHTGIPDIDIPIYTIKTGNLTLPISLSYHASGLKVEEMASWVGAGWSLNAGGVITRTVIGAPDEKGLSPSNTQKGYFSDYGCESYLFSPGPAVCDNETASCPQGRPGMPSNAYPPQDSYFQGGIFDGEPDLFFFDFNGYSGKFYFNDDRTPVLVPEQDLKIVPIYPGNDPRGITGFIITTPDGVQYQFGQNPNGVKDGNIDAIEITQNLTTQANNWTGQGAVSAWYLNKITSADGLFSISLVYTAESYSYYNFSMYPIPSQRRPEYYAYSVEYDLNKNFINGVRLSKIIYPYGEVDFNPGETRQDLSLGYGTPGHFGSATLPDFPNSSTWGAKTLGSINIQAGTYCKKDNFFYSYTYDNNPVTATTLTAAYPYINNITTDQYRLRLDSIGESTCDNTINLPPYKFSYFPGTVPRQLSFGIDHWGFYNGVSTNTGLIPTYTVQSSGSAITTVTGADRDTHWPNSLNGALQQITYPTGGTTGFEFESNDIYGTSTSYSTGTLTSLALGSEFGQSNTSDPGTITTNGNAVTINLINNSTYTASLVISNAAGQVYTTECGNNSSINPIVPLAAGTYSVVLSLPFITGGSAQATFTEPFQITTTGSQPVGGLRIKAITSSAGMNAVPVVTSYGYNYNNSPGSHSSGVLFSVPTYVQETRNDAWAIANGATCSSYGCITCFGFDNAYYQSPSSIRPMSTTQGNHIGYGDVFVSQSGNGYSEYRYYGSNGVIPQVSDPAVPDVCVRTLTQICDPSVPNSPAPPVPYDPMRGELAFRGDYAQNGQLLKSESFLPAFQIDPLQTPGIISKFFVTGYMTVGGSPGSPSETLDNALNGNVDGAEAIPSDQIVPVGIVSYTEYALQSARKVRDSTITQTYDPTNGNYITQTSATYYNSPYHHQPTQSLSYSSKGETILTNFQNAFDFRVSNFTMPDGISDYNANVQSDNNYLNSAIPGVVLDPSDPNYYWQRLTILINYRYMKAIDRQNFIAYRLNNFTGPSSTYSQAHSSAKTAADVELKPVLELQDKYENPVIEQTTWRNNTLTHATFEHYDYVSNPSGFVYPNKGRLIDLSAPSATYTSASVSGNSLISDSRFHDEVVINFDGGNPQQVTPRDGITTTYLWDYLGTEPICKVTNANASDVAYTSFEADGSGNWTIGGGTLNPASGITGRNSFSPSGPISKSGLNPSTTYIVSYWAQGGALNIPGTISGYPVQGKRVSYNSFSWTLYVHKVTGQSTISLTGSGPIDELRLYPSTAQMVSFTHDPLIGITSQTDPGNRATYYEYDDLFRLSRVRDQDYDILKTYDYQLQFPNQIH